jgi:hypothetical protein
VVDSELLNIVWGETSQLSPKDKSPQTTARLQAVLAKMAIQAKGRGLAYRLAHGLAPRSDKSDAVAAWAAMSAVVGDVEANRWRSGAALPEKAVLWEIDEGGKPPRDKRPPQVAAWILNPSCPVGGDFVFGAGLQSRTFRLFESPDPPGAAELPFLSSLTGSGVPQPPAQTRAQRWIAPSAWIIGIASALLFLVAGVFTFWGGRTDGLARLKVQATQTQYEVIDAVANVCLSDAKLFPSWRRGVCSFLINNDKYERPVNKTQDGRTDYGDKVGPALAIVKRCFNVGLSPPEEADAEKPTAEQLQDRAASCELVARAASNSAVFPALSTHGWNESAGGILGLQAVPGARSTLLGLLGHTLGIAGLAIALGLGTKGRLGGIWIDERSRYSLARAQVTLWTIVALGGFATIALFNVGLGGETTFPKIPIAIAAALGIAFASPMLSALILDRQKLSNDSTLAPILSVGNKKAADTDFSDRALPGQDDDTSDTLESRASASQASITDLFVGEHISDKDQLDISRLQNVVLTATLVLGYFYGLVDQLSAIPTTTLLTGFLSLPDPGAAFTSVLLVSHATYLSTKLYAGRNAPLRQDGAQRATAAQGA